MNYKYFTNSERIKVYAEGKLAFKERMLRGDNPYTASKDLAGLWRHGWDIAERANIGKTWPIEGKL
jgi:hypothetical protein